MVERWFYVDADVICLDLGYMKFLTCVLTIIQLRNFSVWRDDSYKMSLHQTIHTFCGANCICLRVCFYSMPQFLNLVGMVSIPSLTAIDGRNPNPPPWKKPGKLWWILHANWLASVARPLSFNQRNWLYHSHQQSRLHLVASGWPVDKSYFQDIGAMQLELQCRQTMEILGTLHVSVGGQAIWNTQISPILNTQPLWWSGFPTDSTPLDTFSSLKKPFPRCRWTLIPFKRLFFESLGPPLRVVTSNVGKCLELMGGWVTSFEQFLRCFIPCCWWWWSQYVLLSWHFFGDVQRIPDPNDLWHVDHASQKPGNKRGEWQAIICACRMASATLAKPCARCEGGDWFAYGLVGLVKQGQHMFNYRISFLKIHDSNFWVDNFQHAVVSSS